MNSIRVITSRVPRHCHRPVDRHSKEIFAQEMVETMIELPPVRFVPPPPDTQDGLELLVFGFTTDDDDTDWETLVRLDERTSEER